MLVELDAVLLAVFFVDCRDRLLLASCACAFCPGGYIDCRQQSSGRNIIDVLSSLIFSQGYTLILAQKHTSTARVSERRVPPGQQRRALTFACSGTVAVIATEARTPRCPSKHKQQ